MNCRPNKLKKKPNRATKGVRWRSGRPKLGPRGAKGRPKRPKTPKRSPKGAQGEPKYIEIDQIIIIEVKIDQKSEFWMIYVKKYENEKFKKSLKMIVGKCYPALRVSRAVTRLTVYRPPRVWNLEIFQFFFKFWVTYKNLSCQKVDINRFFLGTPLGIQYISIDLLGRS